MFAFQLLLILLEKVTSECVGDWYSGYIDGAVFKLIQIYFKIMFLYLETFTYLCVFNINMNEKI